MSTRDRLPVLIGAHRYDTEIESISWEPHGDIARVQDTEADAGEQSIENFGLWNRSAEDFVLGAGQRYFDLRTGLEPSVRERFRWSKGLDVFAERREASLLPSVTQQATVGNGDVGRMVQAGTYLYAMSGNEVERSDSNDPTAWTNCTGEPTGMTDMAVVGGTVYVCNGADVESLDGSTGATAFAAFSTEDTDFLVGGPGRLLGMHDNDIWEFTAAGAKLGGANIHSHFDSTFAWKGGAYAPNGIYVFGDAGNFSEVYLLVPVDSTGALPPPYPVMETPPGERINRMVEYAGVIVLCTTEGIRLAQIADAGGVLSYGPLIELGDVLDVAFDGKFAYVTVTDFKDTDGTTSNDTGLAVLSLDRFTRPLTPAWASHLMIGSTTGAVRCVAVLNGRVVFGVDDTTALDVYVADASDKVATGTLYTGGLTFATVQFMAISSVEIDTDPLPDGSSVDLSLLDRVDSSDAVDFGSHDTKNGTAFIHRATAAIVREEPELKITVNRGSTTTADPKLRRWTVRGIPMIRRSEMIEVPIKLYDSAALHDEDQEVRLDTVEKELAYLRGLSASPVPVTCELFGMPFMARVERVALAGRGGFSFEEAQDDGRRLPSGTWLVRLETVSDAVYAAV